MMITGSAQREEDAQWQKAQEAATRAAMKAYITRYPHGRYLALARRKDQEYQPSPPRPSVPFAIDESIWRTLEASEMYRNALRPRAARYRSVWQTLKSTHPTEVELTPLGEKCEITKRKEGLSNQVYKDDVYSCGGLGGIPLGMARHGVAMYYLKSLKQLSGSLYPPRIGAEQRAQYEYVNMLYRQYDTSTTSHCSITGRMEANQLSSRLTSTAWAMKCPPAEEVERSRFNPNMLKWD